MQRGVALASDRHDSTSGASRLADRNRWWLIMAISDKTMEDADTSFLPKSKARTSWLGSDLPICPSGGPHRLCLGWCRPQLRHLTKLIPLECRHKGRRGANATDHTCTSLLPSGQGWLWPVMYLQTYRSSSATQALDSSMQTHLAPYQMAYDGTKAHATQCPRGNWLLSGRTPRRGMPRAVGAVGSRSAIDLLRACVSGCRGLSLSSTSNHRLTRSYVQGALGRSRESDS